MDVHPGLNNHAGNCIHRSRDRSSFHSETQRPLTNQQYNYRLSKTEGCFARSYRISEAKLFTEFRHSIDYKEKNPNVIVNKLTGVE